MYEANKLTQNGGRQTTGKLSLRRLYTASQISFALGSTYTPPTLLGIDYATVREDCKL